MKLTFLPAFCRRPRGLVLCSVLAATVTLASDSKFEAQLIWGTNDSKSPDPKHKPVEAEVQKKLSDLPLKWKNYFEVNRKTMEVPQGESTKAVLSEKCTVEVKELDGKKVEVSLVGKGEPVLKRTQPLPKGEILVLGGNAPNATAWLVTLKRTE
ncbi:MAG TPA: hypothetical protein VI136_08575 [Verrucomicrobiae bacterium]